MYGTLLCKFIAITDFALNLRHYRAYTSLQKNDIGPIVKVQTFCRYKLTNVVYKLCDTFTRSSKSAHVVLQFVSMMSKAAKLHFHYVTDA